jgi:hypothetical protein
MKFYQFEIGKLKDHHFQAKQKWDQPDQAQHMINNIRGKKPALGRR